jgi:hypothetical protein
MSRQRRRRQLPYGSSNDGRPFWQRISTPGWLFIGLVLGLLFGLYYAWVLDPIVLTDSGPSRLSPASKAEYIFLVSQSYAVDGNWDLAQERLTALEDPNLSQSVNDLLETYVRDLDSPNALRNMANLAQQLGAEGGAVAIFAPTPVLVATPTLAQQTLPTLAPTPTPFATAVPVETATASATPPPTRDVELVYTLLNQERQCAADGSPQREIITQDAFDNELGGVEVQVVWANGRDRFYTGFKPTEGAGYADFSMEPDTSYTVFLAEGSSEISGLRVESCPDGSDGGWLLIFQKEAGASR